MTVIEWPGPGREADALVAEHVMEWKPAHSSTVPAWPEWGPQGDGWLAPDGFWTPEVPSFTEDSPEGYAAMRQVIEKMVEGHGFAWQVWTDTMMSDSVAFSKARGYECIPEVHDSGVATGIPEATCVAALRALGHEVRT